MSRSFYEFRTDIPESWWRVTAPVHIWETAMDLNRPALNRPALNRASSRLRTGGPNISAYGYFVNEIGQRQTVTTSGSAMAAPATTRWGYDTLGQLVAEDFANNQATDPRDRGYAYDLIGNREKSIKGSTNPLDAGNLAYDANSLNQYDSIGTFEPEYDDDGNLFIGQLHSSVLANLTGTPFTATLRWNGENRLTKVEDNATVKATYQYDFMGRRVRKQVGNTVTWYVYDGFNELGRFTQNGTAAPAIERTYTWGLDISNTPQGAGGVGGLLAIKIHGATAATYYPSYDANGNISEYFASNGSVAAHFEYDGFGNSVVNTDTNGLFDYRFSTKLLEDVTGLYYYTYRYYDPLTGRWPSRDPIEEEGGVNLYGFLDNAGSNSVDVLGLCNCGTIQIQEVGGVGGTASEGYTRWTRSPKYWNKGKWKDVPSNPDASLNLPRTWMSVFYIQVIGSDCERIDLTISHEPQNADKEDPSIKAGNQKFRSDKHGDSPRIKPTLFAWSDYKGSDSILGPTTYEDPKGNIKPVNVRVTVIGYVREKECCRKEGKL